MKKLTKLKLNDATVLSDSEMKNVVGGAHTKTYCTLIDCKNGSLPVYGQGYSSFEDAQWGALSNQSGFCGVDDFDPEIYDSFDNLTGYKPQWDNRLVAGYGDQCR